MLTEGCDEGYELPQTGADTNTSVSRAKIRPDFVGSPGRTTNDPRVNALHYGAFTLRPVTVNTPRSATCG